MGLSLVGALTAHANPTGGAVAAGSASIAGQGTSAVTINQTSNTAVINWQSFSIGSSELTKFVQPSSSSAALNRVLGGQTSFIQGTLSANGQIYLLNGNGIVVGPGGVITTAGFTGSTRDISDADFLSGHLHFVGSSKAGIKNLGNINALGGDVVLIGNTVENRGTINASGTAGLVAGDDVLLAQNNPDGSTITVNPVSAPSATSAKVGVRNTGTITASSAELKAANGNIYALAIQNQGIIRATTVTHQGGHIYLTSDSGTIVNSGTLDASAIAAGGAGGTVLIKSTTGKVVHSGQILARGGQGGAGGKVEISGAQLSFTGTVDLRAPGGTTGDLLLDPTMLTVVAGTNGTAPQPGNPNNSTIGATFVDNSLNTANVTLSATQNVTVSSAISWDSGNTLTLTTTGSSPTSIAINAAITDQDTNAGGLTLSTAGAGDSITAPAAISVANFILQNGAFVQNVAPNATTGASQLPAFTASHDFEIQGGTFLRASGGDGSSNTPYQLIDIYGVQGINGFLSSNFNLGTSLQNISSPPDLDNSIDASSTATWNGGAGFAPIGSTANPYTATFGNTGGSINDLTIDRPNAAGPVGLFSVLGSGAEFYYVNLNGVAITGNNNVGAYVGTNEGTIFNAFFGGGSITGNDNVGAFAGNNQGTVAYSYFESGTITGTSLVGGLVGLNGSQVYGGSTGGTVTGTNEVGGVAGENDGTIDAMGGYTTVTGTLQVGGMAGLNIFGATVSNSNTNGSVTGNDTTTVQSSGVGGLVGENDGTLSNSYNVGTVNGDTQVGGMVGFNNGTITGATNNFNPSGSFNTGTVTGLATAVNGDTGNTDIGGVAGLNQGVIMDSYNSGTVTGQIDVGGVAGENQYVSNNNFITAGVHTFSVGNQPVFNPSSGIVQTSYNNGAVNSGDNGTATNVGGVVGLNDAADYNAVVNTCYNVGAVGDGGSTSVGGVVGTNYGTVENTYNSGSVTGTALAAGLIGTDESGATAQNSYWDVTTSMQVIATNNLGATETALVPLNVPAGVGPSPYLDTSYANFEGSSGGPTLVSGTNGVYEMGTSPDPNGGPAWYIIQGQTRPLLAMEQSTNIQNAHQLQLMAVNLTDFYEVTQYIDASGTTNPSEIWNSTTGFVPVGADPTTGGYAFQGSLAGEGQTINALFIDRPTTDDVGVIGYFSGNPTYSSISNVNITNVNITGDNDVGSLVGQNIGSVSYITTGQSANDISTVTGEGDYVGGIVGSNGETTGNAGTLSMVVNYATVKGSADVGGLAGQNGNTGTITQSINEGAIGAAGENDVGGLAGINSGQIDDDYSTSTASVTGGSFVGGLVGYNSAPGIFETSYSTTPVTGTTPATTGALVGENLGIARHAYWENDNANAALPGIGTDDGQTTDVVGYSAAELADIHNYAQGEQPVLWNFTPQNGSGGGGIWGINVYGINGQINNGLPVLQWQTPVNTEVSLSSSTVTYGESPTYTATGEGAGSLTSVVNPPTGPTLTISDPNDTDAGSTHTVTFSGNPNQYGYNVEYVNGSLTYDGNGVPNGETPGYTIVPAQLNITADSFTIPFGAPVPPFTASYDGFAYNDSPSDLNGTLNFTVDPALSNAVGVYNIQPGGQSSSNYNIFYVPGTLAIVGQSPIQVTVPFENQEIATVEAEIATVTDRFGRDPFNGLDPLYYMTMPTSVRLEGDFLGAINNEANSTDIAYISSTSSLPAISRLVTPGTGVVTIVDGFVVVGCPESGSAVYLNGGAKCLPGDAIAGLRRVLSRSVYQQLQALIYGRH